MAKKKTVGKIRTIRSSDQKTVIVVSKHSAKDTLFPEKLKKANEILKNAKFFSF